MDAYKLTEEEPVAVQFAQELESMRKDLESGFTVVDGKESFPKDRLFGIYDTVVAIYEENIRPGEKALLEEVWKLMETAEKDASEENRLLPVGSAAKMAASLTGIGELNMEIEDARVLKGIKEIVLPKDVREKAGIEAGDKLAVIAFESGGKVCCISLLKSDAFADSVKDVLGPMMSEIMQG